MKIKWIKENGKERKMLHKYGEEKKGKRKRKTRIRLRKRRNEREIERTEGEQTIAETKEGKEKGKIKRSCRKEIIKR